MSTLQPGSLGEYLQNDKPVLFWVQEVQNNRIRVLTQHGRESKIPLSRVLPWPGPRFPEDSSRQTILETLRKHSELREEIVSGINILELWELAQEELDKADAEWFAGLLWDDPSPDRIAAMGRSLLSAKTHFKFQPPFFFIHPRDRVEERIRRKEEEERKNRLIRIARDFFQLLWQTKGEHPDVRAMEEKEPDLSVELENLLLGMIADPSSPEFSSIFEQAAGTLPANPHLPLLLAQYWGLLPPHHNFLLNRAGYDWGDGWSRRYAAEIEARKKSCLDKMRPPEPLSLISVDSSATRDIDDCFSVSTRPDGGFILFLGLACPALSWDFESPLGKAVEYRATSVYLPEGSSHMLPEELGTEFFSLKEKEPKPSLLIEMQIDAQGNVERIEPRLTWIAIERNVTYREVEDHLSQHGEQSRFAPALSLARTLRTSRLEQGAVILDQPDPIIRLEQRNGDVSVSLNTGTPSPLAQLMVSEFMILANTAVARWAIGENVPLLYRTQDIATRQEIAGVWSHPVDIYRMIRFLAPTILETEPGPHRSLGVNAYSPVTSPLRRFPDLLNVGQIIHFLEKGKPLYSSRELEGRLPYLNSRLEAVGKIQRFRPRYWKLVYLKQHSDADWPAVVVDIGGNLVTLSLPREQILLRAQRSLFDDSVKVGEEYLVRLGKIKPLHNEIAVLKVQEKKGEEDAIW